MPNAKRLPSGMYRCRAYSHKDANGKKHYKSFTAPTSEEAEFMAVEFKMNKRVENDSSSWTLGEAIDHYIDLRRPVLSPTTIQGYEYNRRKCFQSLMNMSMDKLTSTSLQKAVNDELSRVSPKSVRNAYGLISTTLKTYLPDRTYHVRLPQVPRKIRRQLPTPEQIYQAVKGTRIELACLLAMWLSFTESEIRGLTMSKSIDGDYITIREVMVVVDRQDVVKKMAKNENRNRRHRMPKRIRELVDAVEGDMIVPLTPSMILKDLKKCMKAADLPEITFHDLRHINASVMAMLRVPDVYAQERGGWKSDHVMKNVYTEIFSEERERVDDMIDGYFEQFV